LSLSAVAAVVAVAGCGASHTTSRATAPIANTVTGYPKTQTVPATGPLPVNDRVLQTSEVPGYLVTGPPPVDRTAAVWATSGEGVTGSQITAETARLQRLGFVAGVAEHLHGQYPLMVEELSLVEQYRSPSGARAELASQYAHDRSRSAGQAAKFVTFPVTAIPGALGWQIADSNVVGINVLFADGAFYYVVGAGFPPNARGAPTRNQVASEATSLYRLVHGRAAS
jgi:hypothetical protein